MPTEREVLYFAATQPIGMPLYTKAEQVTSLTSEKEAKIGLSIRPVHGGGAVSIWWKSGKGTVSGNHHTKGLLLSQVSGWTTLWFGDKGKRAADSGLPSPQELLRGGAAPF